MELYFKDRNEWREWLEKNHAVSDGVWLIYYKKLSGKPRIAYDDAVEEAICFGWIDGKIKRVNEDYYEQWFTPRRQGSRWSELNLKRASKLIEQGKMMPPGLKEYNKAKKYPERVYSIKNEENTIIPADLEKALAECSEAQKNFMNFPPSSRRLYIFWLNSSKREATRISRIARIVSLSEKNIKATML